MIGLLPGDPVSMGPFALSARLGPGAIGPLYLGESPDGGQAAVRVLRQPLAADGELRVRLAQELTLAREVRGPFLARLAAAWLWAPGQPASSRPAQPSWIAWEYVPGPSLAAVMSTRDGMPMSQVAALAAGLGAGLRALHEAGVVHGDLHPGNVFVVDGMPRLTGFGTRVAMEAVLAGVRPSSAAREFLAPEQAAGGPASMAGDVFSLAAVLVRAAGGTGPFAMGSGESFWVNLGGIPPELRPLVTRCLDRDPGVRPTAAEFRSVVAAAHPALLSPEVASGQVRGPITWPDHDPDAIIEPAAPVSPVVPVSTPPASAAAPASVAPASTIGPVTPATPASTPVASNVVGRPTMMIVCLFAAAVMLVLIGVTSNGESSGPVTSGSVPVTSGSDPGSAGWLYLSDYHPGDCLSTGYPLGSTDPWPDPQFAVPCTQPHAFEVIYANDNFWPANEAYPGQSELELQADEQCLSSFYAYVGSNGLTPYSYTYQEPASSDDWATGDRYLECVAFEPDPATLGGELLITQSAKGTGQ